MRSEHEPSGSEKLCSFSCICAIISPLFAEFSHKPRTKLLSSRACRFSSFKDSLSFCRFSSKFKAFEPRFDKLRASSFNSLIFSRSFSRNTPFFAWCSCTSFNFRSVGEGPSISAISFSCFAEKPAFSKKIGSSPSVSLSFFS